MFYVFDRLVKLCWRSVRTVFRTIYYCLKGMTKRYAKKQIVYVYEPLEEVEEFHRIVKNLKY